MALAKWSFSHEEENAQRSVISSKNFLVFLLGFKNTHVCELRVLSIVWVRVPIGFWFSVDLFFDKGLWTCERVKFVSKFKFVLGVLGFGLFVFLIAFGCLCL